MALRFSTPTSKIIPSFSKVLKELFHIFTNAYLVFDIKSANKRESIKPRSSANNSS
ncbi:14171_t:CDS:2 [Dentiscutata erythropus]|uniref:14171_t:CDS:1 n=1 Tax=Dentiscutata erythropus TaxID=1348616 RepID=A0A9N9ABG6_9GLOM|nr:14171_t:CDS:2 [Dentiscutata erythropus]